MLESEIRIDQERVAKHYTTFDKTKSKRPTVLVIDDDKRILEAFKILMASENCNMIAASDTEEVLGKIEGKELDLIITDFILETKSSIEIITLIRKKLPNVPVAVMTGYSGLLTEKDAKSFGVNYFLKKPLDLTKMRQIIRTCCNPLHIYS